ncbi:hypothetical protein [Ferruginibacter sp.]|nr:hypothetical protein [Ferruginibacter sp.]
MNSKILSWIGMAACVALILACFLPWTYYADSNIATEAERTFTGFFSYQYKYGRPGKFFVLFALVILILMLLPKIWAKRTNLFLSAFTLAYAIKSYILFTSCYNAYCPEKRAGIYIMLFSTIVILIACVFPNMKIAGNKKTA